MLRMRRRKLGYDCCRNAIRGSCIHRNQLAQVAIKDIGPNLAVRERIDRAQFDVCPTALDSDTAFHHPSNTERSRDLGK